MSDFKSLNLPSAKELCRTLNLPSAPEIISGANNEQDALEILRQELAVQVGGKRQIKTPIETVIIDDDWLAHIVEKRDAARERYARWIIPTLEQPTEIWQAVYENGELRKRYIKLFSNSDGKQTLVVISVAKNNAVWNFFPTPTRSVDNQRNGELLFSVSATSSE